MIWGRGRRMFCPIFLWVAGWTLCNSCRMGTNLREIAERAGVSVATVSRALRGRGTVSEAVEARVRKVAKDMGYKALPLLGAVLSQVRRGRGASFVGSLAIVHVPSAAQPEPVAFQREVVEGARSRAEQMGFVVELFELGGLAMRPQRLGRVLEARGVRGVIVLHDHREGELEGFAWEKFALAQLDYAAGSPALHTVCIDHHHTLGLALRELAARGMQRAGLAIERMKDDRLDGRWSGAFYAQARRAGMAAVEPLVMDGWEGERFGAWLDEVRPDVVLGHRDEISMLLRARNAGERRSRRRGEGTAFVSLNKNESRLEVSGLDLVPRIQGAVAVDAVVAQIFRGERGPPGEPRTLMVAGRWVEGNPAVGG